MPVYKTSLFVIALLNPPEKTNDVVLDTVVQVPNKVPSDFQICSFYNSSLAASEALPLPLSTVKVTEPVDAASVSAATTSVAVISVPT